jgi:hypothetical protein
VKRACRLDGKHPGFNPEAKQLGRLHRRAVGYAEMPRVAGRVAIGIPLGDVQLDAERRSLKL